MKFFRSLIGLRRVLDAVHNGIVVVQQNGEIAVYNRAAGELLKSDPNRMLGKQMREVYPHVWRDLKRVLETGTPQIGEKITINGRAIIANRTPIVENRQTIGVMSVFQDISEYERIATKLESHKKINSELNAIINSSFDGLWVCDQKGKVVIVNEASEKINDIAADQVIGKNMEKLVLEGLIDRSVTLEVLKKKVGVTIIQQLNNGRQILVTGNPVLGDNGEISLVVVNERDITNLNKLRSELEESKALASRYRSELSLQNKQIAFRSKAIIRSRIMHKVLDRAMKVAQVDSIVLIEGETGSGKGFYAKLIHGSSPRSDGPFIRVDCGAIPENLMESELFGYEKGAFTGARTEGKPGLLELAEGGTLFLDEIGDLPLNLQVKLLRFLEENIVMRVGGISARNIDARIVAATNRNLKEMVKKKEFRGDLFFRLNVVPIYIPPLRNRTEDIPPLINYFLKKLNEQYGMDKVILPRTTDCLCKYPFPGNIREMANLVEQIFVLSGARQIRPEDLPSHVHNPETEADQWLENQDWNLPNAVAAIERKMIIRALRTWGSQRKAASILGIDQSTLARKAKKYNIRKDAVLQQDA